MSNRRRPQLKQEVNSKISYYDVLYRFYKAVELIRRETLKPIYLSTYLFIYFAIIYTSIWHSCTF